MALVFRQRQPDPLPGTARACAVRPGRPLLALAWAFALVAAAGCQSGGLLSIWRQGNDDSLSKGPTKDEVNDNRNLMARWLTPKRNPHSNPDAINPTPLMNGSDGY